jgi:hypothetical protein
LECLLHLEIAKAACNNVSCHGCNISSLCPALLKMREHVDRIENNNGSTRH